MPDIGLATRNLDLTGSWWVKHRVRTSEQARYVGLDIDFHVTLRQDGQVLSGHGEKFAVDQRLAARDEASRLEVEGRVEGRNVRISLVERSPHAPDRAIVGTIAWQAEGPDRLTGSFQVDLADTSGSSEALRA